MLNELKKVSTKHAIARITLSLGVLFFILVFFATDFVKAIQGPKDIYSLTAEEIPGAYVKGDIYAIIDVFAEYYDLNSDGSESSTKQFYTIPVGEEEYAALEVNPKDFDLAEQIYNETYDYLSGNTDKLTTSMTITGTFNTMDEDILKFFNEMLDTSDYFKDYSKEEIDELVYPFVLQKDYIGSSPETTVYIFMGISVLALLYILVILIKVFTGAYLSSIRKYINSNDNSVSQERIEADFENAVKTKFVRIGETWTYFYKGVKPVILKNSDIVWAYQETVTHKYNGIKTGTTRSVILYDRNKTKHTLSMKKYVDIELILETYTKQQPHMVLGFNEDLKAKFNKDFDGFLKLAYYQSNERQTEETDI